MYIAEKIPAGILILAIWNLLLGLGILLFTVYVTLLIDDALVNNFDYISIFVLILFLGLIAIPLYSAVLLLQLNVQGISGTRSISIILICLSTFLMMTGEIMLGIVIGCCGLIPIIYVQSNYVKEAFKEVQ